VVGIIVEAELFSAALGLQKPRHVSELDFSANKKRFDISIDYPRSLSGLG